MTPEELNAAHRDYVVTMLGRHAVMVNKLMTDDDPATLSRFVVERGAMLAEFGLIPESDAVRVNRVFLALYKNTALEQFGWQWSDTVSRDSRASEVLERMNVSPLSVSADDFRYIYDKYISSDAYVLPALEIMLADSEFRSAMDLEDSITVDEFRRRALAAAWNVTTFEQFQEVAQQYAYFGPFICASTVCAVALCVVFAFCIAGPGPVTCTSGTSVLGSIVQMLPPQAPVLESACVNHSSKTAWVVVKGHSGFRRAPLRSGESTEELGLRRIEALLIGGHGNELSTASLPSGIQSAGCYVLSGDASAPCVITLVDSEEDGVVVIPNDAQDDAERRRVAGYSSVTPGNVAPYADKRFTMDSAAALLPADTDRARIFGVIDATTRHARALRVSQWLALLAQQPAQSA